MSSAHSKQDIQRFWGSLYDSLYEDVDASLTPEILKQSLDALEDMFRFREHMAVIDMPSHEIVGKKVLEIGCGAGGHSALFASHGAKMTSVDITPARVQSTQRKFELLGDAAQGCRAMQADAENLPFEDGEFDIVYSNGVLHHTHDTEKAIAEVHRVLKPGGKAVIMLYCKSSWQYWINLWLCIGVLMGRAFRDPNWVGKATEWGGKNEQSVENPITRCYSAGEIHKLFSQFEKPKLRKREFYFRLIPKLGKIYLKFQRRRYGEHPGGLLVYGEPWVIQSPLELWLGKLMGFAWFITTRKPEKNTKC